MARKSGVRDRLPVAAPKVLTLAEQVAADAESQAYAAAKVDRPEGHHDDRVELSWAIAYLRNRWVHDEMPVDEAVELTDVWMTTYRSEYNAHYYGE